MIDDRNRAHRSVPSVRGRFETQEPSLRPHRKGGLFRGRFVQPVHTPTSCRHQRGQDWPANVRAVALLLPFTADGPGLDGTAVILTAAPAASSTCTGCGGAGPRTVTKAGVAVVPADLESPARAVRSFDLSPETRAVWLGLGSWNQRGASHRICVRGQRVPRRVLIGKGIRRTSATRAPQDRRVGSPAR